VTELSGKFGVSRKTAYKWAARYRERGREGLRDLGRAPHRQGRALEPELAQQLIAMRVAAPLWGPRKLRALLQADHPQQPVPAASTIGDLLRKAGLVPARRRRRRWPRKQGGWAPPQGPNEVWAADFKGWVRTADGRRCDPLTVSDLYSRYLLGCQIVVRPSGAETAAVFERLFREYGMPRAIRTDNGPPFASSGLGGLSRLAVKWLKAGIELQRIAPGQPAQNGCHERMHRTLKAATTLPPAAHRAAQQRRFDRFRMEFNQRRPHEALGQTPPAAHYQASPRRWPARLPEPAYGADYQPRRVRSNGEIKWCGELIFISESLAGELVAALELACGDWLLKFCDFNLAVIDRHTFKLRPAATGPRPCPCNPALNLLPM
jgi:putative transposase